MAKMQDINVLMVKAQAEAARRQAMRQASDAERDDQVVASPDVILPEGTGVLTVEKRQGRWRCYLAGERIRSGDAFEVYVDETVGWLAGRLHWGRGPHTPPSLRRPVTHPTEVGRDGEPLNLGEVELLLPEDAVCRWPEAPPDNG